MKIDLDCVWSLAQAQNSTHEILTLWYQGSPEPTVGKLIGMLKYRDPRRMDAVEILENWVEKGDSK